MREHAKLNPGDFVMSELPGIFITWFVIGKDPVVRDRHYCVCTRKIGNEFYVTVISTNFGEQEDLDQALMKGSFVLIRAKRR